MFEVRPLRSSSKASSDVWKEFRVFSFPTPGETQEHCRGVFTVTLAQQQPDVVDDGRESKEATTWYDENFDSTKKQCTTPVATSQVYETLTNIGLLFGPTFRNLTNISYGTGKATATITIPDTKKGMPFEYEHEHLLHPATIDAFLQSFFPALTRSNIKEAYMPTFIQKIEVSNSVAANKPGFELEAVSEAAFAGYRQASGTIYVRDPLSKNPVVTVQGLRCTAVTSSDRGEDGASSGDEKKLCFDVQWALDLDLNGKDEVEALLGDTGVADTSPDYIGTLEMVASYFYQKALKEVEENQVVQPHHQKLYRYMQHHREQLSSGKVAHQTSQWLQFDTPEVQEQMERLISTVESADHEAMLLCRVGKSLSCILKGDVDPLALMLEGDLLYKYYENALGLATTYAQLGKYITLLSHKHPNLRFLEIGAGTGGATLPILQALGGNKEAYPRFEDYTYTDISSGFFEKAQDKFRDWGNLIRYRKLNIEQDAVSQGFAENEKFDVVVAFNVLHATANISNTISNVRKLLKEGGKLLLLEMTLVLNRGFLPFGTLPGWWMSEEDFRPWGPTMDEATWDSVLGKCGFGGLSLSIPDHRDSHLQCGRLMVAEAIHDTPTLKSNGDLAGSSPSIIIITTEACTDGEEEFVAGLQQRLLEKGLPSSAKSVSQLSEEELTSAICIFEAEMWQPLVKDISPADFEQLKLVLDKAAGLLWLTVGGSQEANNPDAALVHGLARTLRGEHPGLPFITLDFSTDSPLSATECFDKIYLVLEKVLSTRTAAEEDTEYSEKGGHLYIKRCLEATGPDARISELSGKATSGLETKMEPFYQPDRPLTLDIAVPGLLDTLRFIDDPTGPMQLPPDYVTIDVRAVGLNFRDIMVSMGQLVDGFLGCECSGIVTEIGSEVTHLKVGDRVCAWTMGGYSNSVKNPAKLVQRIPDNMEFVTAAAIPVVYCTAYYALVDQARIRKGESILIHAAAGGVGQAAIMMAQFYGAEVFVTVGTKQKKEHIMATYGIPESHIFSSRNLSFAEGIKRQTAGKGVDVILNCLSGEALKASWSIIAPFGRFIEIGKKDIEENTHIGMAPFIRNVTFASVDLTVMFKQRRDLALHLITSVMALLRDESIGVVTPITTFPFSKMEEAFRYMQMGKHMGKVVLTPQHDDIVPVSICISLRHDSQVANVSCFVFRTRTKNVSRH
jgi:NADPH:quinone reductase-like Zn-dependent oxidoreductase/SAM-dependent methyltransferase